MKNWIDKNRKLLIYIIIVLLVVLLLIFGLLFGGDRGRKKGSNKYVYNKAIDEAPGTEKYSNENLIISHCLKGICISDTTFYYRDNDGRIEYTIINNSKKKASGYLYMVFKEHNFLVVYQDLKPGESVKSKSQYFGVEITDKNDYTLRELTKKELNSIEK